MIKLGKVTIKQRRTKKKKINKQIKKEFGASVSGAFGLWTVTIHMIQGVHKVSLQFDKFITVAVYKLI